MSFKNLFKTPKEGIVEFEESYIRFMIPAKDGYKSVSVPLNQADIISVFRKNLSTLMAETRQISVVTNIHTGVKVLPFPQSMEKADMLEHLQLKREEYFGVKSECQFILRPTANKESNEMLVSFVVRSFFNRIKQVCQEEGYILNRVTNVVETMIGAYSMQSRARSEKIVCLLAIGYCNIHMVVLKNGVPLAVRTSLTGSVKEIENRLMSVLRLSREEVDDLLTGKAEADENSLEIIQQNERELLSRISPFFAYIRSLGANVKDLAIYLVMPYISLPGLPRLLENNFSAKVHSLNTDQNKQVKAVGAKADLLWVIGSLSKAAKSFMVPRPPFLRFNLNARMAWMFIIFFLLTPLGLAKLMVVNAKNQLIAMHSRYSQVEALFEKSQRNKQDFAVLQSLGNVIQSEVRTASPNYSILKHVSGLFNEEVRLEKFVVNNNARQIFINGVAIDNEAAIKLWESVEKLVGLSEVRINFPEKAEQQFTRFVITAQLGGVN